MRYKMMLAILLGTLSATAQAQQARALRPDPLPLVQMAVAVGNELRNLCVKRYPELAPAIEEKFRAWPLRNVKTQVLVNGREYASPFVADFLAQLRIDFAAEPEENNKAGCASIERALSSFTQNVPEELLKPFLQGAAQP